MKRAPWQHRIASVIISILLALGITSVQAAIPSSERAVLLNFYTSTNGATWTTSTNWNGAAGTECTWFGVGCNDAGTTVLGINLFNNNLTGALPSDLNSLTNLNQFDVMGNQLTGSIPSLTGLTNLQAFIAGENQLTGSIPALTGLTNLQSFSVDLNQLTGSIPALTGLTNLQSFYVSYNRLTGDVPSVPSPDALVAGQSGLCPNLLNQTPDPAWDAATGVTPWYTNCAGAPPPLLAGIEYTDVYYNSGEPGWGVFVVQSNTFQFLALFIYGPDGKPVWYTGQITDDGTGNYTGTLYASTGTYFASPWQGYNIAAVGTVSFEPSDAYHATLIYTVNGVGPVTKSVQRQTLTPYVIGGNYSGSMSGSVSGCTNPASNNPAFRGTYNLMVTQVADQSATLTFSFVDTNNNGLVCTLNGPLTHLGRLYQMANAGASCTGSTINAPNFSATIDGLHPTNQGIEGYLSGNAGGGCILSWHFGAVKNVNN